MPASVRGGSLLVRPIHKQTKCNTNHCDDAMMLRVCDRLASVFSSSFFSWLIDLREAIDLGKGILFFEAGLVFHVGGGGAVCCHSNRKSIRSTSSIDVRHHFLRELEKRKKGCPRSDTVPAC